MEDKGSSICTTFCGEGGAGQSSLESEFAEKRYCA